MRRLIAPLALFVTLIGTAVPVSALTIAHLWSQRWGSGTTEAVNGIAMDASGNVTIVGAFSNTVDFGGGGGGLISAGGTDIFIAKYNSAGAHVYSKRIGGTLDDVAMGVSLDGSGNPVIAGYFNGTVDFGGGGLLSAGGRDIFVAKYVSTGSYQWALRFGAAAADEARGVAVDAMANVYVTGIFAGTVSLGGVSLIGAGSSDIFLAKYNTAGGFQWSQRFGSTSVDEGNAVTLDPSGNVLIAGNFNIVANFGGGALFSAGADDICLAKFNSAGAHLGSKRFGSATGAEIGWAVATDASGDVVLTGYINGSTDFGGGLLVPVGTSAVFVAMFDGTLTHQWSRQAGSMTGASGRSVAVDNAGNVLLTGRFTAVANFGGSALASVGGDDIFLAKYTNAGVHMLSTSFGSGSADSGFGVIADPSRNILLTGTFGSGINFGGSTLISNGGPDVFLAKFAGEPHQPVIRSITDIGNDQGRQVLIDFTASGDDQPVSPLTIVKYEAYRRVDAPPSSSLVMDQLSTGQLLAEGWTHVAEVPAHGETGYTIVAPTIGDSTIANGQYRSTFYVRAAAASPYSFYDSPIDSGYSVDNLAPGIPDNFVYVAGDLSWTESSAADFDYFTVYGSNVDNFGSATVVDYSVAPELDVNASPYTFYYVTATDFSGNEGKPAKVNTLSGVGGSPKNYVLSLSNYPNPFNPRTTVSYTIPSRGNVSISIYDARGALVATLFNGDRSAGAYTMEWDGRGQSGTPVSTGVYFARIEHASGTRSKKMVLLK